jgi:hypothetical protein
MVRELHIISMVQAGSRSPKQRIKPSQAVQFESAGSNVKKRRGNPPALNHKMLFGQG